MAAELGEWSKAGEEDGKEEGKLTLRGSWS